MTIDDYSYDEYPQDEGMDHGEAGASGLPPEHWGNNPEWVQFADSFVQTLQNDPAAIETWYADFAKENGLRGLAEAIEEQKFSRVDDPGLRGHAIEGLKDLNRRRREEG